MWQYCRPYLGCLQVYTQTNKTPITHATIPSILTTKQVNRLHFNTTFRNINSKLKPIFHKRAPLRKNGQQLFKYDNDLLLFEASRKWAAIFIDATADANRVIYYNIKAARGTDRPTDMIYKRCVYVYPWSSEVWCGCKRHYAMLPGLRVGLPLSVVFKSGSRKLFVIYCNLGRVMVSCSEMNGINFRYGNN